MPAEYGLKIRLDNVADDVEDCTPKQTAFNSKYPCAKILQDGKVSASTGFIVEVSLDSDVSFPFQLLCFLYDASTQEYEPAQNVSFDSTKIYLPATAKIEGSFFYYFVCYA